MRIVLASRSPRRLDLLQRIGFSPEVMPANIDETQHENEPATKYVQRLSREKAQKIADELGAPLNNIKIKLLFRGISLLVKTVPLEVNTEKSKSGAPITASGFSCM